MDNSQKDSFIFYKSFYDAIKKLKKKDQLIIYSHICEYVFDSKTDELEGVASAIFDLIKPQIDANLRRYENGKKGAKYGVKGGRPKTPRKPLENPKETPNVNVNDNDNVNVNVNENVNAVGVTETHPSLPPSEKICQAYIDMRATTRGITPDFNASKFISYYNARDWMSGNTKIADWRAAVDIWLNRSEEKICADDDEDPFGELKGSF